MIYFWDDLKYWLEDNWLKALTLVGVLTLLGLGIKMIVDEQNEGVPKGSEEVLQRLITESEEIKVNFSLLEERITEYPDERYPYYEVDLYVKQPFITQSDLELSLKSYVDTLKLLLEQEGMQPKAVRFNLYDRKALWEQRLDPKGVYEYRWSYREIKEDQIYTTAQGTITETVQEAAWRLTTTSKGKPDYSKYALEGNYHYLRQVNGVEPLTDQEFEWYLKYDAYRMFGDPTRVYMEWELGGSQRDAGNSAIGRQFRAFQQRLQAVGDKLEYHDYPDGLKLDLIITHPQFLYYQETGKVAEDDIDARSKLLASEPQMYTNVINQWLEEQARQQVNQALNGGTTTPTEPETYLYEQYTESQVEQGESLEEIDLSETELLETGED